MGLKRWLVVLLLACGVILPRAAECAGPGRIVAVDQGHVFFENGDVYSISFGAGMALAFVGNVYRQIPGGAPAPAGLVSPGPARDAPGLSQSPSTSGQRCAATTRKGTQCSRRAQPGSAYCWQHQR